MLLLEIFFVYKKNNPEVFPCHSNKDDALTLIILRINSATALKQAYNLKKKKGKKASFKKCNILLQITKENKRQKFTYPKYIQIVIEKH